MIRIYHNPACSKSRAGLKFLQESGVAFTVVEYLKKPFTEKELEVLLVKLNKKPADLLRQHEDYYKQQIKGKNFSDHELIRIMVENPKLIQRPVVEGKYRAVVGNPVEEIAALLSSSKETVQF
jgi:arsenate reductase